MKRGLLIILLMLAAGRVSAYTERTVTYYRDSTVTLQATLYLPETEAGSTGRGAVVAVHEGGFNRGSRHCFKQWGAHFAELDMATMAIDYRLVRQGGAYPEALKDCIEAVRWLKAHADSLGVNRDRIVMLGSSAGAYLAVMTALAYGLPDDLHQGHGNFPDETCRVRGVISSFGLYDWEKISWRGDGFMPPEKAGDASPVRYTKDTESWFLLFAGERDHLFPPRGAQQFADALRRDGKKVRIYIKPKQDHTGICDLTSGAGAWEMPYIDNFIDDLMHDCNCGRKTGPAEDRKPKTKSR